MLELVLADNAGVRDWLSDCLSICWRLAKMTKYRITERFTGLTFDFWDIDCAMEFAIAVFGYGFFSIEPVSC